MRTYVESVVKGSRAVIGLDERIRAGAALVQAEAMDRNTEQLKRIADALERIADQGR